MSNVYYRNAKYEQGEEVLIVGANSKSEARSIIDNELNKYDFNGGIVEIMVFEEIPKVKTEETGILEVY